MTDGCVASSGRSGLEPIGSPERAAAIAETEARLLDLGAQEEALVEQLLDDGERPDRRPGAVTLTRAASLALSSARRSQG